MAGASGRAAGLSSMRRPIADSGRRRNLCRTERPCYFFAMIDLPKGDRTRARILDEAVDLASVQGLGGLTIGPLAERLGLSKSGLFAHFQSKEALQVETLDRAAERFRAEVTEPLRAIEDRRARLRVFFERWIAGSINRACPAAARSSRRPSSSTTCPGPVHDAAARHFGELQRLIAKFARAAQA